MLQALADWLVYGLMGMDPATKMGSSLNFFIYDSIKIIILLFVMITAVGYLRTYMHPDKVKLWLTKRRYGSGNFVAALFGAVTPFCSCSSVPIFFSFIKAGVPLGVSFSFLITSPLVNEYLVV
ncbi:MAG: permease, partial [Candidatus Woesearchaeota archaeon]